MTTYEHNCDDNYFKGKIKGKNHSELTLVIDGNWVLMSRLSPMIGLFNWHDESAGTKLQRLICRSINGMLRRFPDIDNIIFTADGGSSWRGLLKQPGSMKKYGDGYKTQRQHDEKVDWGAVFNAYSGLIERLRRDSGVTVLREKHVEGDDWCWWLSNALNSDGTNVIIWSGDRDLTQLVKTDPASGVFTVTVATRGRSSVITQMSAPVNEPAYDLSKIFGNPYYQNNTALLSRVSAACTDVKMINPEMVVLDKVFRGDVSDNVMPAIKRRAKSGKEYRLAEKALLGFSGDIKNDNDISLYINNIYATKPFAGAESYTRAEALERAVYNRSIVMLDRLYYPADVLEKIEAAGSSYSKTNDISVAEQRIISSETGMSGFIDNI